MLTLHQLNNIINSNITLNTTSKIIQRITNKCSIYTFIIDFYKSNNIIEMNIFIIGLIYLNRYAKLKYLNYSNVKQVLETCLILAIKYCVDEYEITDSGPLESHVLKVIDWDLYVKECEYKHFEQLINSCIKD